MEAFAKKVRHYMADPGEWEECGLLPMQSLLPQVMSPVISKPKPLVVPVTQSMANLLYAILQQTDDLKTRSFTSGLCTIASLAPLLQS